ncbi:TPA_asm: hypothetical protein [Trichoplax MELD virus]|nr:TPA_asm: hypothetical protein [Trichoplax MELD virus]
MLKEYFINTIYIKMKHCTKSVKNRDYSFVSKNHENVKKIKATCIDTDEVSYYHSIYNCQKKLGINCGIIKMSCDKTNRCKSGKSKVDGKKYKFDYVDEIPDSCFKESQKKRSRKFTSENQ